MLMEVPATVYMVTQQEMETRSIPGPTLASANLYVVVKLSNQMSEQAGGSSLDVVRPQGGAWVGMVVEGLKRVALSILNPVIYTCTCISHINETKSKMYTNKMKPGTSG